MHKSPAQCIHIKEEPVPDLLVLMCRPSNFANIESFYSERSNVGHMNVSGGRLWNCTVGQPVFASLSGKPSVFSVANLQV